jgi:hypothetical protein
MIATTAKKPFLPWTAMRFQGNGTWVPVGECQTDAMALALLAKKVGGKYALVGNGEPAYLMKKSIDGREHAQIAVYSA